MDKDIRNVRNILTTAHNKLRWMWDKEIVGGEYMSEELLFEFMHPTMQDVWNVNRYRRIIIEAVRDGSPT